MPFEFASLLSPAAANTAKPFSGYPPYHFTAAISTSRLSRWMHLPTRLAR